MRWKLLLLRLLKIGRSREDERRVASEGRWRKEKADSNSMKVGERSQFWACKDYR
jgi:hypothetical protein